MVMLANQPPYLVYILTSAVGGQWSVVSERHWQLAAGNRQLLYRIAIPVHPISGSWGDELNTKNKVSRFHSFKVSKIQVSFVPTLKL